MRTEAEAALARRRSDESSALTPAAILHELQVHQIELEMQNETLRQAQAELEASRDRYVDLYEFAPVGYVTLSREGVIEQLNLPAAALLGLERTRLQGRRFAHFIVPEDRDRWYGHVRQVLARPDKRVCEIALCRGDNEILHVQADCLRMAGDGAAAGLRMALSDITQRKHAERELQAARAAAEEASRVKSSFLANMSHEIRTPLHIIVGLGHLLRRDLSDPLPLQRLDQLCASSDHLLSIINNILDLSRIEALQLVLDASDFRLGSVLDKVQPMLRAAAEAKGLALALDIGPRLDGVRLNGDALRLAQVLINLGSNAVKFTDQGGVRLEVGCLEESAERLRLSFVVEDTGIGMTGDELARIFEPFTQVDDSSTRSRGGSGLGLAISQRMVKLMGGVIRVDSQPGKGSRFTFQLVLPRATTAEPVPVAAPSPARLRGRRVLFAEDNHLSQEILFEMLEDLGCQVDVASDGIDALDCARAGHYDLILMDMQMPRMDGLTATRAIRALPGYSETPIVALTANAFAEDRRRCLEAGMNGHLGKPVTPASLAATLGQWLPLRALPTGAAALCDSPLMRALADIPDFQIRPAMCRSPAHLADYRALLGRFVAAHGQDPARLREYLQAGDPQAAHVLAHDLKGIAGLVGAMRIQALAGEIMQGLGARREAAVITALVDSCEAALATLAAAVAALPPADAA